ncbi:MULTISPECIES: hypothetical protein [Arthrospira]|nr:hypothetical protein [Arthrospira platensis]MDF2212557.1 hypothetical protein [Arthrospira platensis NCB002]MDT9181480.1 hypothetical protein [Limnospira sp. PMC 289.06]MDT9296037.1 hypothetical protein [Arthrospira platensis PCC 7345]MDT9311582.1 hypothetical protein [Limnospira sp. Paracas R14]WAK73743.1 hypothetical protein AP9108_35275 [Arthrospira sp. PCC 9108]
MATFFSDCQSQIRVEYSYGITPCVVGAIAVFNSSYAPKRVN